jgi:hypothetical protein
MGVRPQGGQWAVGELGGSVAKFHARPSAQYRYEHYDPRC